MRKITRTISEFGRCWQCNGTGSCYTGDPSSTTASTFCSKCLGTGTVIVRSITETEEPETAVVNA